MEIQLFYQLSNKILASPFRGQNIELLKEEIHALLGMVTYMATAVD